MRQKLFVGPKVRALRTRRGWRLEACAQRLGISVSYLSQIEANQRPVSDRVLMGLIETFGAPAELFEADNDQRLIADLREAAAESGSAADQIPLSELRQVAEQAPAFARRFLDLHRANHRLGERLKLTEEAVSLDEGAAASSLLPYEEVRDFFHFKDNYLDALDRAAEDLAQEIGLDAPGSPDMLLEMYLRERLGVRVRHAPLGDVMRRYDPVARELWLNAAQPTPTRAFQMAYHVAVASLSGIIEMELDQARFKSGEAVDVCRVGLGNYAAGALVTPYRRFAAAARALRHDVEQLAALFGASLEQVCHRLSTLQRPGHRGVALYFVRLDYAGNITKRHSATRFRFARFGGACPLWNVHDAVGAPDRFLVQLAAMPDGVRYLCVARAVVKRSESYLAPDRRYVLGFGCEIADAHELVYSEGLDLKGAAAPIGVSCRICERDDCAQRAFPPVDRRLNVPKHERRTVPYRLGP
ncbi:short-chain fatty acyl-CoA regulator family protein [Phenylobacterium sp.]|uniref:helix-turn-helix domain-containing protein n=1 Tax=Phenylobacterium sp. TaxID=1871053 RepID=UPI0025F17A0C|nr:short-chain fatty acyl-CoA regulator family protein [Phenylobacterium sp.]